MGEARVIVGSGMETYLYCAATMSVDDSFTLPSEQVRYTRSKLNAKTLGISIQELICANPSVK